MKIIDKDNVGMKMPEEIGCRVVKDLEGYRVNDENFVGVGEITVTITLKEYRSLVGIAATVEQIKSATEDRAIKAESENRELKSENAKLKQENYDLQKYTEQLQQLCAAEPMDNCCKCADEQEEE